MSMIKKSIYSMTEEEFEEHLRELSKLSAEEKRSLARELDRDMRRANEEVRTKSEFRKGDALASRGAFRMPMGAL